MKKEKNWAVSGNYWSLNDKSLNTTKEQVAPGIYKILQNPITKELFLEFVMQEHNFDFKIYGIEKDLIKRVPITYENTNGNLGVLLNGKKGTGKTVTAKSLANEFIKKDLPTIIVPQAFDNLPAFINNIMQNIVLVFDEYEKMYSDYDNSLLTVMDGILDNGFRRVYLLTTNKKYLNENMLERPGRIRYTKEFKDLDVASIIEVVDDSLIEKKFKDETIEFLSTLETITVDIVKAVVSEVNIHKESPYKFKDFFNISIDNTGADIQVTQIDDPDDINSKSQKPGSTNWNKRSVTLQPSQMTKNEIDNEFYFNGSYLGYIERIIDENIIVVNNGTKHLLVNITRKKIVHDSFKDYKHFAF